MNAFKVIFYNCVILMLLFFIVELSLRQLFPNYHYYYRTHPQQANFDELLAKTDTNWVEANQDLGWVCQQKVNLAFPSPPRRGVHYKINSQGFRNSFDFRNSLSTDQKRVLLIGDSFLFNIYLSENETTTNYLQNEKGTDYLFYNMAVPAWGIDQMYLAYQKYVNLVQPDQVIFVFVDEDFLRSMDALFYACGEKPCFKIEDNDLQINEDPPMLWEHLCWHNQIGNRMLRAYYEQKSAELAQFMFEEIIVNEKKAQRNPAFIRIPALVDLQNAEAREVFSMEKLMKKHEVNYLELYDTLAALPEEIYSSYYILDDGHLSESGAELLGDYILEWVE